MTADPERSGLVYRRSRSSLKLVIPGLQRGMTKGPDPRFGSDQSARAQGFDQNPN